MSAGPFPASDPAPVRRRKRQLRRHLRARRASLTADERQSASHRICEAVLASPVWRDARSTALFHSMADEVCTSALLQAAWRRGRPVALPRTPPLGRPLAFHWVTPDTRLVRAAFGALEPPPTAPSADLAALHLVLTPGLGFDARGARLGYGGGYYDRTLAHTGHAVLLAFGCQRVEHVPEEPHDRRVHSVVTENGWRSFGLS